MASDSRPSLRAKSNRTDCSACASARSRAGHACRGAASTDSIVAVIRVVIADDHTILREGLKRLLSSENDVEVVGEARDGHEALQLVRERDFDVLLLDLSMPGRSGMDLIKQVRS